MKDIGDSVAKDQPDVAFPERLESGTGCISCLELRASCLYLEVEDIIRIVLAIAEIVL